MGQNFARNGLVMLSVSYAGKNPYSADKTNGLLRVDAFLVNTGTCWPTVGGEVKTGQKDHIIFEHSVTEETDICL